MADGGKARTNGSKSSSGRPGKRSFRRGVQPAFLEHACKLLKEAVIVSTDVISPGSTSPLRMDWRLINDNGAYKINDVIIEGISMAVTQRSEFASVVQRNGGQVRDLIALMREKTASEVH